LLYRDVIVPPILCEAPDYVEWSERMQSERGHPRSDFT
jgi:hypothetical protein